MKERLELLAPAGSEEAFRAALRNGADAIYLGAGPHHARQFAGGFTEPALFSLVEEAHAAGVRVYLTLNILLGGQELDEAVAWAARAWQGGVDAVIVQDVGLARQLHRELPALPLHASTQMSLHNAEGVLAAKEAGISRVVLARELSLSDISAIHAGTDMELEVFGHGALCVSFSGQCLMSSLIGGRSGNRGTCAQPCRLPWTLSTEGKHQAARGYLLSMKDLMTLPLLHRLAQAGVCSLKLEGRMKSPEYVATVTGIYRRHLDRLAANGPEAYFVDPGDEHALLQIFNRGGFTHRNLSGTRGVHPSASPEASGLAVDPLHPKHRGVRVGVVRGWRMPYAEVLLERPVCLGDGLEIHKGGVGGEQAVSAMLTALVKDGAHVREGEAGSVVALGDVKAPVQAGDPVYRTSSKTQMQEAGERVAHWQVHPVPVTMSFSLMAGAPARLVLRDDEGHEAAVLSPNPAEPARERPLAAERVAAQLMKTGDAPWAPHVGEMHLDGVATLPVSAINAMRREALAHLREQRVHRERISGTVLRPDTLSAASREETSGSDPGGRPSASVPLHGGDARRIPLPTGPASVNLCFARLPSPDWLAACVSGDWFRDVRVIVPLLSPTALQTLRETHPGTFWVELPLFLPQDRMAILRQRVEALLPLSDGFSVGNPGMLRMLRAMTATHPLLANEGMNLWNAEAISQAAAWGADMALLSPELPPEAAAALRTATLPVADWAYGRVRVMTTAHCPGSLAGPCDGQCARCSRREGVLTDRAGAAFPWHRDPFTEKTDIQHAVPTRRGASLWHPLATSLQVRVTDEPPERIRVIVAELMAAPPLSRGDTI